VVGTKDGELVGSKVGAELGEKDGAELMLGAELGAGLLLGTVLGMSVGHAESPCLLLQTLMCVTAAGPCMKTLTVLI
jgi:hypothetical protein